LKIIESTQYFNADEKNYLKTYMIPWLLFLKRHIEFKDTKLDKLISSTLEFDIDNVRKSLRINFPIDLPI